MIILDMAVVTNLPISFIMAILQHTTVLPQFSSNWNHRSRPNPTVSLRSIFNPKSSLSSVSTGSLGTYSSSKSGELEQLFLILENDPSDHILAKEAVGLLLQTCGRRNDIETGRKIHKLVSESIRFRDDFVLNTRIITMYSMCGSPSDSRSVFDSLQRKNLFQWNAFVSGLVRNELYHEAIEMYVEMISETEFNPDSFTFPCVIKACAGISNLGLGKGVHGSAVKMGLMDDVFVGNALVSFYGKCGLVKNALELFDEMPVRNLVSWNTMISVFSDNGNFQECFRFFRKMFEDPKGLILPDVATLVTILPVCAAAGELEMGLLVHGLAVKLGLDRELAVNNALIDMYAKCSCLSEARILFRLNKNKNVVSWNTMMGGLSAKGDACRTFDLLLKMQLENEEAEPDEVTILSVLPVCSDESLVMSLKELHGYSVRRALMRDELVANAFVAAYAKCGSLVCAERVFRGMKSQTLNSWNALIGSYAQNGDPKMALNLFLEMKKTNLRFGFDLFTIGSLILACSRLRSLAYGKQLHGFVLRNRLEKDSFICVSLLSLYMHCEDPSSAQILFDALEDKSLVSWNAMMTGYMQNGFPDKTLVCFRQMLAHGIRADEIAITSVLTACSDLSSLRLGKETHCHALKNLMAKDSFVGCSIIDMYAKSGSIKDSSKVFKEMKKTRDIAPWNAMVIGYGIHGRAKEAIETFLEMQETGRDPDEFTFIGILSACNHAGLIEKGLEFFGMMTKKFGLDPKLEHYACVVDMLGRSGRLIEAFELVEEMCEEPDVRIWSSLLSSCRIHGDVELGVRISEKLLELYSEKPENYVLVSNFLAETGKWEESRRVRKRMKEMDLRKDAGISWIELEGRVYSFVAGL